MIAKIVLAAIALLALNQSRLCSATPVQGKRDRRLGRTSRRPRPAPLRTEKNASRHRKGYRFPSNKLFPAAESVDYAVSLLIELSHNEESEANADQISSAVITAYNTFQPSCNSLSLMTGESIVTVEKDSRILNICVHSSCLMRNCTADSSVFDVTATRQLRRRRRRHNVTSTLIPLYSESGSCMKPSQQQVVDRVNANLDLIESRASIIEITELQSQYDLSLCSTTQPAPSPAPGFSEMKSTIPSASPNLPGTTSQSPTEQAMVVETPTSRKSMVPSTPPSKRPLREGNKFPTIVPSHLSISNDTSSIPPSGSPSFGPGGFGLTSEMPTEEVIRSEGPSSSTAPSKSPSASLSPSVSPSISSFPTVTPKEWTRRGQTIVGDKSGDGLGRTLSISGDGLTIIAGARGHDGGGDFAGIVRAYSFIDETWVSQDISSGSAGDAFGTSVSLSSDGRTVLVGALGQVNSIENPLRQGYAKVFVNDENGTWSQLGQTLEGNQLGDGFGTCVSLSRSGDTVAVGAHGGVVTTGYVQIFRLVDEEWVRLGSSIPASLPLNDMDRVMSLSGDGSTVAIVHENAVKVFAVDLFRNDGWKELSDPQISGKELALSLSEVGRTLAVGSWQENLVRIMNYKDGVWEITKKIPGEHIGISVNLSPTGEFLATGSVRSRFSRVQVFALANDRWSELGVTVIHEEPTSFFGSAVALSSEDRVTIVAGNPIGPGLIECYYYAG